MAIEAQIDKLKSLGALSRGDWQRLWTEHGPMAVSALLVLSIAAVLANNVVRLLAPPAAPATDTVPELPRAAPGVDIGAIINAHLFGAPPAPAINPASAPATSMNLSLAGTIAGTQPELGWAIIGENAAAARVVRVGSQVQGGAVLKAVYPDRVVLDLGGRLESLTLPRLAGGAADPTVAADEQGAAAVSDLIRNALDSKGLSARAGELIRPQPVFENGTLRGVRAYPGRNRSMFKKLGLMPGDLITAINGAQIDDVQTASNALRDLGSEPVQITIERFGKPQQVSVDPGAVAAELSTDGEGMK
jgi:general secretion pathway protein C